MGQHLLSITLAAETIRSTSVTPPTLDRHNQDMHAEFEVPYQLLGS